MKFPTVGPNKIRIAFLITGLVLAAGGGWNIYANARSRKAFRHVLRPLAQIPIAKIGEQRKVSIDIRIPNDRHWRWLSGPRASLQIMVGPINDQADRSFKRDALEVRVSRGGEVLPVKREQGHNYVNVSGFGAVFRANPGDLVRIEIAVLTPDRIPPETIIVHPYFDFMTIKGQYAFDSLENALGIALIVSGGGLILIAVVWWIVEGRRRSNPSVTSSRE